MLLFLTLHGWNSSGFVRGGANRQGQFQFDGIDDKAEKPARGQNRIVNVSSVAALVPGPFVSVHFATRAHLLSFSLALAEEHRGA